MFLDFRDVFTNPPNLIVSIFSFLTWMGRRAVDFLCTAILLSYGVMLVDCYNTEYLLEY